MARYAFAAAAILALAGIAVHARQQPAAEKKADAAGAGSIRALAREQVALADKAIEIQQALVKVGNLPSNDPSFSMWGRRRLEALRKAGAGKAEMVAALEKYIEGLRGEEASAQKMVEAARATQAAVLDIRYRLLEAEIWLKEERAR